MAYFNWAEVSLYDTMKKRDQEGEMHEKKVS